MSWKRFQRRRGNEQKGVMEACNGERVNFAQDASLWYLICDGVKEEEGKKTVPRGSAWAIRRAGGIKP